MEKRQTPDNCDDFLAELTALTKKHGLKIGGCGCCGSPFITVAESVNGHYVADMGDELRFVEVPE